MSWNWATKHIKNNNKKQREILNDLLKKLFKLTQFHFLRELYYFEYGLLAFL